MKKTSEKRLESTLKFITEYQLENSVNPSYREIMRHCGQKSLDTVKHDMDMLTSCGKLTAGDGGARNVVKLPENLCGGRVHSVPVVGSVPCGEPVTAVENIESMLLLPDSLFGTGNMFILRAKGRSMINCGIFDGDLMVVDKDRTACRDDIVIALVNGDEATAKILSFSGGKYFLSPGNDETDGNGNRLYHDIPLDSMSSVIGVVTKVIHTPSKNAYGRSGF